ncbi:hypothetical protein EVAR_61995_1 [Eumeta japonica]|uniref:Uncharacterized protein n=1 Tax=Eumeta variegata TaxID=151549 RepID=A0A4C1YEQ1_EUMVA|nr:hypothetical protein EVAR_61995_1 [Eumeta japonica]
MQVANYNVIIRSVATEDTPRYGHRNNEAAGSRSKTESYVKKVNLRVGLLLPGFHTNEKKYEIRKFMKYEISKSRCGACADGGLINSWNGMRVFTPPRFTCGTRERKQMPVFSQRRKQIRASLVPVTGCARAREQYERVRNPRDAPATLNDYNVPPFTSYDLDV